MRFLACLAAIGVTAVGVQHVLACGGCGCMNMPRYGYSMAAPVAAAPAGCCMNGMNMNMRGMNMNGMNMQNAAPASKGAANMNGMKISGMDMKGMNMQNAAPASKASAKSQRLTLAVSGMHCEKCPAHVAAALTAVPAVKQVLVDSDRQEAIVLVDAGRYDEKALLGALKQAGFEGKVQK